MKEKTASLNIFKKLPMDETLGENYSDDSIVGDFLESNIYRMDN